MKIFKKNPNLPVQSRRSVCPTGPGPDYNLNLWHFGNGLFFWLYRLIWKRGIHMELPHNSTEMMIAGIDEICNPIWVVWHTESETDLINWLKNVAQYPATCIFSNHRPDHTTNGNYGKMVNKCSILFHSKSDAALFKMQFG